MIPIAQPEFPDRLLELSRQADYTVLIAPETTGVLANLTRILEQAGVRTLGSSADSIELAGNKARLAERLEARGIPDRGHGRSCPPRVFPKTQLVPACSSRSTAQRNDTFFLTGPDDLPDAARQMPVALLQPFLPGLRYARSFLIDDASVAWLISMGQQQIAIRNGRFHYEGGICPYRAGKPNRCSGARWCRSPASGFVGVDFSGTRSRQKQPCWRSTHHRRRRTWGSSGSCRRDAWPDHGWQPAASYRARARACRLWPASRTEQWPIGFETGGQVS